MGVAPEAIVEFLFEYRLKNRFSVNRSMQLVEYNSSVPSEVKNHRVAHSALPMGVTPEAIIGCLRLIIGSRNSSILSRSLAWISLRMSKGWRHCHDMTTHWHDLTKSWPSHMRSVVIFQISARWRACRFRLSRHIAAHVPSIRSYIRTDPCVFSFY
jgi:hypothetical protein